MSVDLTQQHSYRVIGQARNGSHTRHVNVIVEAGQSQAWVAQALEAAHELVHAHPETKTARTVGPFPGGRY